MIYIRSAKADLFTRDSVAKLIQQDRRFKVKSFKKHVLKKSQS